MTPEVIARVDAWLDANQSHSPALRNEWWRASGRWHAARDGGWALDGRSAAMSGILLALVREAWGDKAAYCLRIARRLEWGCCVASKTRIGESWRLVTTTDGERWVGWLTGPSEVEALVAALEAAQ